MFTSVQFSEQIFELIGVAGIVFYILAYTLLQLGIIIGQCYTYTLLNLVAALLVLVSLTQQFNLAVALLQVSWVVISIVGIFRLRLTRRQRKHRKRIKIVNY